MTHAVFGAHDKLAAAGPLLAELGVAWDELAVMGDDWPDLPLLVRAGLALAPANAHAEVRAWPTTPAPCVAAKASPANAVT